MMELDPRLPSRFWEKVDTTSHPSGCWIWQAAVDTAGYGRFALNGKVHKAHRVSYEALVGPIPEGLHMDHLCRVPPCVNPDHLEPVTNRENALRGLAGESWRNGDTCRNGLHPWPESARLYATDEYPRCIECKRERARRNQTKLTTCPICGTAVERQSLKRHQGRRNCVPTKGANSVA